jgi:hypothetical protein
MPLHTPPSGRRLTRAAALALGLFLVAGCDGGGLQTVKGKVTVDGAPLTSGSVRFVPDAAKGNKSKDEPAGEIGSDGTYTLSTNGKPGAPPGWYKVTVNATSVPDSSNPFGGKALVAPRFNSPESSQLSVEVVSSPKAGAYDLTVSAR